VIDKAEMLHFVDNETLEGVVEDGELDYSG